MGPDPIMVEHSTLITYSSAGRPQAWHSDTGLETADNLGRWAKIFSAFIYFDDVTEDLGPFDAIPGSHSFAYFLEGADDLMNEAPFIRLAVPQGSIVIYDTQLKHRGGPNTSPLSRPSLCLTFMEQGKLAPLGATYSVRDFYRHYDTLVTVGDIVNRRVPEYQESFAARRHDDKECLKQIHELCPPWKYENDVEQIYRCAHWYFVGEKYEDDDEDLDELQIDDTKEVIEHATALKNDEAHNWKRIIAERKGLIDKSGKPVDPRRGAWHGLISEVNPNPFAFDKRLSKCGLLSRVEMLLERGIFAKDFIPRVSWGRLDEKP
uniref:Phytanoyl-CoA dioxygenase family protein n=1 Tax=Aplanochytrium stocchinoi TaxID=215587 RepID=A0A7S3PNU7_9STRA